MHTSITYTHTKSSAEESDINPEFKNAHRYKELKNPELKIAS